MNNLFLLMPSGYEWIIVVIAIILLFGGRKIPELMKGLGQGMKEFKKARNDDGGNDNKSDNSNAKIQDKGEK